MKIQTRTIVLILRRLSLLQLIWLLLCLVACSKTKTPVLPEEENSLLRCILGTYDISYEGEHESGSIMVDFVEGDGSGLSYSLYTGSRSGSLNSVDSFHLTSGTAKTDFSYLIKDETLSCSVELSFIPTSEDEVSCKGVCTVSHEDGSLETLQLSGNRIWKIGEKP